MTDAEIERIAKGREELIEAVARGIEKTLAFEVEGDVRAGELSREEQRKVAQAALAALKAHGMVVVPGWRPIESAPRNWDDVLVFSPEHEGFNCEGVFSAFYDTENKGWFTFFANGNMRLNPTHWMPLPAAPMQGEG